MNSKQLQYAIELAEVCNFSKVSEKLNISQPALSKQIINLENDLGVKLFDRKCVPMRLTAAGEHFIKEAKELLYREDQLKRSMDQYRSGEYGRLSIGLSPFRSLYLIPQIAKKIRARFPGVEISISDTNSEQIRKDVVEGKLDFAIVNLPVDESVLDYIPIEPDILVLAVPNEMLDRLDLKQGDKFTEIDFKDCRNLPCIVVEPAKEMRRLFEQLCAAEEIHPPIAMEVVGLTTAWAMARAGIGATLLPLQFLDGESLDQTNLSLFKIKNDTFRRQPVIVTRRGQYLSDYAKYAINLLRDASTAI
ncbi:MAG: LysR family transcriptional regulator [Clostridia bacterium]|nr:LysR family transcriptional regulator [Clostridia bacterium]